MAEKIPCRRQSRSELSQSTELIVRNDPTSFCWGTRLDLQSAGYALACTPTLQDHPVASGTLGVLFFFNPREPLEVLMTEWESLPKDCPALAIAIGGEPGPEFRLTIGNCPLLVSQYGPSFHQVLGIVRGWRVAGAPS